MGLCLLALAAYIGLSLTGPTVPWWRLLRGEHLPTLLTPGHPGGPVGAVLDVALNALFGAAWCWGVPVVLALVGVGGLINRTALLRWLLARLAPLWLATVAMAGLPGWSWGPDVSARWAGASGVWIARGLTAVFGLGGGRLFTGLAVLVVVLVILRPWLPPLRAVLELLGRGLGVLLTGIGRGLAALGRSMWRGLASLWPRSATSEPKPSRGRRAPSARGGAPAPEDDEEDEEEDTNALPPPPKQRRLHLPPEPDERVLQPVAAAIGAADAELGFAPAFNPEGPVELPDLDLLREPEEEELELSPAELDAEADLLEDTLRSFGVQGEVKDVRPGPVVTTFEYQPAAGIRVSQIVQRSDDLALAMKARSLRMEAPIPGKAAVGIEIPNSKAQIVRLREVVEATRTQPRHPLTVVLGKDVEGQPVAIDLAAQPHLLVAGSTGSGKSVCINAMVTNLLLYNDPSLLRLLLIDPKMLELNVYNGIPHLLLPVVTDPKEALRAMKWMTAQMDLRYRQLAKCSVRNIEQYNAKVARGEVTRPDGDPITEPMPYYLTIVDELADLMMQLGQEFEIPVTRLAQKARAVGIHLILATQRPSVDVLTGVIKANIPCRIAFRVIQKNDSRTILDMNGAEALLGKGDMLYLQPGRALPVRVHGALVEVEECEAVAAHWREYSHVAEEISLTAGGADGSAGVHTGDDDLFNDAVRVVVTHQSGSTSLLQRRLRIGYTRAGRLMDMMEEAGIVGPFTGSKARDVLVKPADLPDLFGDDLPDLDD